MLDKLLSGLKRRVRSSVITNLIINETRHYFKFGNVRICGPNLHKVCIRLLVMSESEKRLEIKTFLLKKTGYLI